VELVNEKAPEALTDVAKARKARMIAIGTHGESPIKGAVLGSTAHKLVYLSETPILVVRPRGG
jgi:nucleotide-binding universal stress UspA family protein